MQATEGIAELFQINNARPFNIEKGDNGGAGRIGLNMGNKRPRKIRKGKKEGSN
jgi:hypothetical protein